MVKYSKHKYNKSKRRYNKSKRKYNKTKRRYNKTKRRYIKKRYSKKNQHGGMNLVRSAIAQPPLARARRVILTPEIIVRQHRYTDLKRPLIHNALSGFFDGEEPDRILPYKFKNNARDQFGGIYTRGRGFKMYVIGVAYSRDNGMTYNKISINRQVGNALLKNNTLSLYFGAHMNGRGPDQDRLLKIFFIRGFFPLYTTVNINREKLAMMVDRFYQSNMEGLSASMANQFFFNVPREPGDYGENLETEMESLIINNQRNLQAATYHGLANGTTLIPVAIDHHLIIDENPDRQKLNDILTHYPPGAWWAQRIQLLFLHSPIHLDAPPPSPPAPPPPPDSSQTQTRERGEGNYTEI